MKLFASRDTIASHPWAAVAVAFVAGGIIALSRSRSMAARAAADAVTAAVIAIARELAAQEFTEARKLA